jgi:hypothetical protein
MEERMKRKMRFGFVLCPAEKQALARLAEAQGGLSSADVLRRLIRREAQQLGFWPPSDSGQQPKEEVRHD